jgi:hypothetical protein
VAARHEYRAGGQRNVSVRELLGRIAGEGLPVRLMWPDPSAHPVRWSVDDSPTGYLPRVEECPGTRSA